MSTEPLYLDAAATTPISPTVLDAMLPHLEGEDAQVLATARGQIAKVLGVEVERLYLVGGGTSANNLAIRGVARALGPGRLISQPTEHPSVIEPLRALEEQEGYTLEWLPLSADGRVDPQDLRAALRTPALLVSIMYANHETGVIQDMPAIARVCREAGTLLHVDGVQGLRTGLKDLEADLLTVSAHKIQGPKGIGARVLSSRAPALSTHESVSTALAVGFACALRAGAVDGSLLEASRDALQKRVLATIPGASVIGGGGPRASPGTSAWPSTVSPARPSSSRWTASGSPPPRALRARAAAAPPRPSSSPWATRKVWPGEALGSAYCTLWTPIRSTGRAVR